MNHYFHGGANCTGQFNGFTFLGNGTETSDSTDKDSAYVTEHPVLKYRAELASFLDDFRRDDWFFRLGLPVSNRRYNQLSNSHVLRPMRRVEQRAGPRGGKECSKRREVQVFGSLDIGHKDLHCKQFVNCRPFWTLH
jgi:hypothetical protein